MRFSTMPLSQLNRLSTDLRLLVSQRRCSAERLQEAWSFLSERIHGEVGKCCDDRLRQTLIRVGRAARAKRLTAVAEAVSKQPAIGYLAPCIEAIVAEQAVFQVADGELVQRSISALQENREVLGELLSDEETLAALALASPSLCEALRSSSLSHRYSDKPARARQVERGVAKYLTRAAAKAAPFGRFCVTSAVKLSFGELHCNSIHYQGEASRRVRLSKGIQQSLWHAMREASGVCDNLPLRLNPTIVQSDDSLVFVATIEGHETKQRLTLSPSVRAVIGAFDNETATVARLASRLGRIVDSSSPQDEAVAYVRQLVRVGLLQHCSGISESEDDWLPTIKTLLRNVNDPRGSQCASELSELESRRDEYIAAQPAAQHMAESRVRDAAERALQTLGVAGKLTLSSALFEDLLLPDLLPLPIDGQAAEALEDLLVLGRLTSRISPHWDRLQRFADHFVSAYPNEETVPLLSFYESYYKAHPLGRLSSQSQATEVGIPAGRSAARSAIQKQIAQRLRALESSLAEECIVSVAQIVEEGQKHLEDEWSVQSATAFCELLPPTATRARVIWHRSSVVGGLGKYYSRFADGLAPAVLEQVREAIRQVTCDHGYELTAESFFNGNVHPTLAARSLAYPSEGASDPPNATAISELGIELRRGTDGPLRLVNLASRCDVVPLDLGFLTTMRRPPLFQLLSAFSPTSFYGVLPLPHAIRCQTGGKGRSNHQVSFWHRPRLVTDGGLVLARRQWIIDGADVPQKSDGGDVSAEFVRVVCEWAEELHLPTIVFMRIRRRPSGAMQPNAAVGVMPDSEAAQSAARAAGRQAFAPSRDWQKPQYIDFSSPVLLALFGRMLLGAGPCALEIEEALPQEESSVLVNGTRRAHELILSLVLKAR